MGTGLNSTKTNMMDRKIPTALWKTQLLKLVSEAPRAVCIDCRDEWNHSLSPDDELRPLHLLSSSSGSTTSTTSSERLPSNGNSSEEKLETTTSRGNILRDVSTSNTIIEGTRERLFGENPWEQESSIMDLSDENPFGKAFHGYLSHAQTTQLLLKDGHFLVRKRDPQDEDFLLTFRFGGQLKNFILSWDDSTGFFYVGDKNKSYGSLQELVQEGLITLYLDQKAGSYIDLMVDLTRFHKMSTPSPVINNGGMTNGISFNRTNQMIHSGYTHGSLRFRKNSASPSPTVASTVSRTSVERRKQFDLKSHSFQIHTFQGLSTCQICQNFLWGLSSQGLRCKDCCFSVHESCVERVFSDCEPEIESISHIFGADLTLLVKAAKGNVPFVLEKCITEIEKRGLGIEGIYRVSGSKELIERLKLLFEKERTSTDLSAHLDIHSMCCLVKLFLRLLSQPLVTAEVFQRFLTAKGPLTVEMLRRYLLQKLPTSHQVTLKFLILHLHRVSLNSDRNRMTAFNLSSVFTPSVICPTEISLNTLKIGTSVIEALITNVPILYPQTTVLVQS